MQEIKAVISEKILDAYQEASKFFPKEAIVTYSGVQEKAYIGYKTTYVKY